MLAPYLLVVALVAAVSEAQTYVQPEQVHLSLGAEPSEMMVTWTTMDWTNESLVEYGTAPGHLNTRAVGNSSKFTDGGPQHRTLFIHRVLLTDLKPRTDYWYHCGSSRQGWSPEFSLRTMPANDTEWSPVLAVYGDMGNVNAQSLPYLQEEAQGRSIDAVLHVGDFAYDMDSNNARVGDEFMRQIEPIAAYVPYMTCVGNHENAYNFSNYASRFSMVDQRSRKINNHFFSFNIGPAHVIGFSTEFYFFVNYGFAQIARQYTWLEQDLKEATKPENRARHPWIITMGHRPMYCSNNDRDDCTFNESIVRKGLPILHLFGLEDLFMKYGVDLEFWAHEHSYERLWPVYDREVYNGSFEKPYTNPRAPVHIVTGSAGCQERLDPFVHNPSKWSAVRISDYGYTRMTLHNASHLSLEQLSAEKEGQILDSITIIKDSHGTYMLPDILSYT